MKYTYQDYKQKRVSGLDYVKDHYLTEGKGEVLQVSISKNRPNRFLYLIKRPMIDYNGNNYIELKLYDLDNPNTSCLYKERLYPKFDKIPSLTTKWKNLRKTDESLVDYISARDYFMD